MRLNGTDTISEEEEVVKHARNIRDAIKAALLAGFTIDDGHGYRLDGLDLNYDGGYAPIIFDGVLVSEMKVL